MRWHAIIGLTGLLLASEALASFGPGEQDYGFVNVREGCHMFWWLFHTTANVTTSAERPLILWLQGGPGSSSTGIGNFLILGPLNLQLNPRNTTWVKDFNVMFVDNPVGTGYSYVESLSYLTRDNKQIARDLVELLRGFYEKLPQFRNTPLYVYGQSYGGKMAVDFVHLLWKEINDGNIVSNISGVAMGNSWIHPIDSTLSWSEFLYQFSLVDKAGEAAIYQQALLVKRAFDDGNYAQATNEWSKTQTVAFQRTDGVDIYNVLNKVKKRDTAYSKRTDLNKAFDMLTCSKYYDEKALTLDQLMNGPVKEALGISSSVHWSNPSDEVFDHLAEDFMKPVTDMVERLLNETTLKVHVYNGNFDLSVNTPGQMMWIKRLRWPDYPEYQTGPRKTIWVNNQMEGYEKQGGKFTMFWINGAGHSVPAHNPVATRVFLKAMTGV